MTLKSPQILEHKLQYANKIISVVYIANNINRKFCDISKVVFICTEMSTIHLRTIAVVNILIKYIFNI